MKKENYLKLKGELKVLAQEIKNQKFDFKSSQRAYSTLEKEYGCAESVYEKYMDPKFNHQLYSEARSTMQKTLSLVHSNMNRLYDIRTRYRHLHIVYCLARGRTLEQIEPKVRGQGTYWANTPDGSLIESIKKEYGFEEERE